MAARNEADWLASSGAQPQVMGRRQVLNMSSSPSVETAKRPGRNPDSLAHTVPVDGKNHTLSRRGLTRRPLAHRWWLLAGLVVLIAVEFWAWGQGRNDVLGAAYAIPDGGGYCALSDSGVSQEIRHADLLILSASKGGTYCCGYTFTVAMKVAEGRGLLARVSASKVRKFQQEWYGAAEGSELKQCAAAVVDLGIGREVAIADAKPGDFVAFQRTTKIGHSVIFLGWIRDGSGKTIGIRYRSSQPNTNGVADACEFFADDGGGMDGGQIDRNSLVVARLNRPLWARVVFPFGS